MRGLRVASCAALLVALLAGAVFALAPGEAGAVVSTPESPAQTSVPRTVISGTSRADVVTIHQNADGSLTVTVNGVLRPSVARSAVPGLVIDGGPGNDTITADAGVTEGLTILGGAGDDVITGGAGDDVIYGGPGNDRIICGSGASYADGGPGNDKLSATGPAMLFGGAGNDQLSAGAGGLLAGGPGSDAYTGGAATTHIYAQKGESVSSPGTVVKVSQTSTDAAGRVPGSVLHVTGGAGLAQQVASDVTALLSLPDGRKLLTVLDDAHRIVNVTSSSAGNQTTILNPAAAFLRPGGRHGNGSPSTVSYDPYQTVIADGALPWQTRPPVVGLCHELIHATNAATGTLQPNASPTGVANLELQAIGLPFRGIAFRFRPSAPLTAKNPAYLTENRFRALLGLASRTSY